MNPFGNAVFMVGKLEAEIRFIPQGIKEFFTLEAITDGELDVSKLNTLCLRYALVALETYDKSEHTEVTTIHGKTWDMWSEAWYLAMPSGCIEAINNHIYHHNNLAPEKVDGLNFI